jgi:hypothetical protein
MATLYVDEFATLEYVNGVPVPIAPMPPVATQTVAISGSSTPSTNGFGAATRYIRVTTDSICSIAIGTTPVATTAKTRMNANSVEYWGVVAGYKIAVIANT